MPTVPIPGLRVRKLADTSGERIKRFDPITGEPKLVNPATPGNAHEPWPLAGVQIEGDPPKTCRVPTSVVTLAMTEGWMTLEDQEAVVRPGGPPANRWRADKMHTFLHAKTIVLHTVDGDVRYRVTHQPDKYVEGGSDTTKVTDEIYEAGDTRVNHYYDLVRE